MDYIKEAISNLKLEMDSVAINISELTNRREHLTKAIAMLNGDENIQAPALTEKGKKLMMAFQSETSLGKNLKDSV